ncbi:Cell division protein FtsB [compost metagenome]
MRARFVPPLILVLLLVILQWQLWNGRGSVREVAQLRTQLGDQKDANAKAVLNNERLASEVNDLKDGLEMVRSAPARNSAWSNRTKSSCR